MNRETETLVLVRDLARLMCHIRPSSLVPTNVEESKNSSKWHDAVREIEAVAQHLLAKDEPSDLTDSEKEFLDSPAGPDDSTEEVP